MVLSLGPWNVRPVAPVAPVIPGWACHSCDTGRARRPGITLVTFSAGHACWPRRPCWPSCDWPAPAPRDHLVTFCPVRTRRALSPCWTLEAIGLTNPRPCTVDSLIKLTLWALFLNRDRPRCDYPPLTFSLVMASKANGTLWKCKRGWEVMGYFTYQKAQFDLATVEYVLQKRIGVSSYS